MSAADGSSNDSWSAASRDVSGKSIRLAKAGDYYYNKIDISEPLMKEKNAK